MLLKRIFKSARPTIVSAWHSTCNGKETPFCSLYSFTNEILLTKIDDVFTSVPDSRRGMPVAASTHTSPLNNPKVFRFGVNSKTYVRLSPWVILVFKRNL